MSSTLRKRIPREKCGINIDTFNQSSSPKYSSLPKEWMFPLKVNDVNKVVTSPETMLDSKKSDANKRGEHVSLNNYREQSFSWEDFSLSQYFKVELTGVDPAEPSGAEESAVRSINNSLSVPFRLEKFIWLGFFICIDSFLYYITYLPIRICYSLILLCFHFCNLATGNKHPIFSALPKVHRTQVFNILRGVQVLVGCSVLQQLNMSYVYHYIELKFIIILNISMYRIF
jgi:hypothetical protein